MLRFLLFALLLAGVYALQSALCVRSFRQVAYRCYFDREEAYEGESAELIEEIENRSFMPLPWLRSEYSVSRNLEFADTHSVITDRTRFVRSFFFLHGRSRVQRRWRVRLLQRGEYRVERVLLVTSDLFGSFRKARSAGDLGGTLLVLPGCLEAPGLADAVRSRAAGEQQLRQSLLEDPFTAATLRPYTGWGRVSRIDWKSSARLQALVTRTPEPAVHRILCIAFTAQTGEYGKRFVGEAVSEHTIRVCATLFRDLTLQGVPFCVQSPCTCRGELLQTPVSTSQESCLALMRALAVLDTEPEQSLRQCVSLPADAQLVLVVPYISEDVRRLCVRHPDAVVLLTAPGETGDADFIPVYEHALDRKEVPHARP
ncbi:MAG: DUF58 domain-containing protein [Oscillospiraceae bacterium]|nr:DUF58 domain-containing protein [Oscillospiraceae bacterium]